MCAGMENKMGCFLVPAGEAVVTKIATKIVEKNEKAEISQNTQDNIIDSIKIPFSRKLKWLTRMLTGGSVLLAFEHVWHGEVVPYFPFLTAASNPKDALAMLSEMSTAGVSMAVLVSAVWVGMLVVSHMKEKSYISELTMKQNLK